MNRRRALIAELVWAASPATEGGIPTVVAERDDLTMIMAQDEQGDPAGSVPWALTAGFLKRLEPARS